MSKNHRECLFTNNEQAKRGEVMMKSTNSPNGKVVTVAIMLALSLLVSNTIAVAQVFQIGNREYRFEDLKWYNYSSGKRGDVIVPDRLIVRMTNRERPVTADFTNLSISGVNVMPRRLLADYYVIEIDPSEDPFSIAQTLFQSSAFEYVEFDALGTYSSTPQDPYFPQQWNLDDTKLQMELAWSYSTGDSSIILAIIDSGTEYYHEDLDNNIWNNADEDTGDGNGDWYPGEAGVDDDGDGLIDEDSDGLQPGEPGWDNDLMWDDDENGFNDDFHGWDFQNDDNTVDGFNPHGTMVAGIAGAQTHNYENGAYRGVAGIAGGWGTSSGISMMILRIKDYPYEEEIFISSTADCIRYAQENGAHVMNLGFGWFNLYSWYEDVINEATNDYNCILVAPTDNDDGPIRYPAKYDNTIAVGATDMNDVRLFYSNYGPEIDVVAPTHVPTCSLSGTYSADFGGTSAASPHVAGLAALIRSVNSDLTWDEVRSVIRNTADKVAGMGGQDFTEYYGYGRVNAHKALASLKSGTLTSDET
jgi:subtilisin family serine protease